MFIRSRNGVVMRNRLFRKFLEFFKPYLQKEFNFSISHNSNNCRILFTINSYYFRRYRQHYCTTWISFFRCALCSFWCSVRRARAHTCHAAMMQVWRTDAMKYQGKWKQTKTLHYTAQDSQLPDLVRLVSSSHLENGCCDTERGVEETDLRKRKVGVCLPFQIWWLNITIVVSIFNGGFSPTIQLLSTIGMCFKQIIFPIYWTYWSLYTSQISIH